MNMAKWMLLYGKIKTAIEKCDIFSWQSPNLNACFHMHPYNPPPDFSYKGEPLPF